MSARRAAKPAKKPAPHSIPRSTLRKMTSHARGQLKPVLAYEVPLFANGWTRDVPAERWDEFGGTWWRLYRDANGRRWEYALRADEPEAMP